MSKNNQKQNEEGAFQKFDELARKLMAVPKKEIDEKQAEYEAQKEKKKARKK